MLVHQPIKRRAACSTHTQFPDGGLESLLPAWRDETTELRQRGQGDGSYAGRRHRAEAGRRRLLLRTDACVGNTEAQHRAQRLLAVKWRWLAAVNFFTWATVHPQHGRHGGRVLVLALDEVVVGVLGACGARRGQPRRSIMAVPFCMCVPSQRISQRQQRNRAGRVARAI